MFVEALRVEALRLLYHQNAERARTKLTIFIKVGRWIVRQQTKDGDYAPSG